MAGIKRLFRGAAIFFVALTLSAASAAYSHNVMHTIEKSDAVVIAAGYEGGKAMRYAKVTLFSPRDTTIEFQNGRTDANGAFAFIPDTPGEWRIVVDDETGHGVATTFIVDEDMRVAIAQGGFERFKKLFTGIGLLLGLAGIGSYVQARKLIASQKVS